MCLPSRLLVLAGTLLPFAVPTANSQSTASAQFVTAATIGSTQYVILGTADFNGDGRNDILTSGVHGGGQRTWLFSCKTLTALLLSTTPPSVPGPSPDRDCRCKWGRQSLTWSRPTQSPSLVGRPGNKSPAPTQAPAKLNVYPRNGDGTFRSLNRGESFRWSRWLPLSTCDRSQRGRRPRYSCDRRRQFLSDQDCRPC